MLNKIKILLPLIGLALMTFSQEVEAQSQDDPCETIELCNNSSFLSRAIVKCANGETRKVGVEAGECKTVKGCKQVQSVTWCPEWDIDCSGRALPRCVSLNCGESETYKCDRGRNSVYFNFRLDCEDCKSTFTGHALH